MWRRALGFGGAGRGADVGGAQSVADFGRVVVLLGWFLIIVAVFGSFTVACHVVTSRWLAHAPVVWELSVVVGMVGTALVWPRGSREGV